MVHAVRSSSRQIEVFSSGYSSFLLDRMARRSDSHGEDTENNGELDICTLLITSYYLRVHVITSNTQKYVVRSMLRRINDFLINENTFFPLQNTSVKC